MSKAYYGPGGALVTDAPIGGITQDLKADIGNFYGQRYFIGESMSESAAKTIAQLLGLEWAGRIEGEAKS